MNVPLWLWLATIGGLIAIILADLFLVDHKPHAVTAREATRWVLFYVALAVAFGMGLWAFAGAVPAGEFFAGYITEYSLSVDNLFVFVIIMAAFEVPAEHQHRVLLVGIVIALVMRGAFIAVGRRGDPRVQLGVLRVRRGAHRHGGEPGAAGHRARRGVQGERGAAVRAAGAAGHP